MPWQQQVADVALEIDPATGLLAHREVVLTVPRQSGKTTLLLSVMVHRARGFRGGQRILYTAQTRNDARRKWEEEHVRTLERSPLAGKFRVKKSNGSEAIHWDNGSSHGITSSTEKAGHGETLDLPVIDEAFAQIDARLEQSLKPTMITRPQPQLWIVSTAGTRTSAYLRGKVDAGRARVDLGASSQVAYFEWSAPPESDPGDPETWWHCMPALGRTVGESAIRANFESMELAEFRRAFLNQWPDDAPDEWLVVPKAVWSALADPGAQMVRPGMFSVDVTPERSHAAVAVAGYRVGGGVLGEVIEHRRGTGWVVEAAQTLRDRFGPVPWVIDAAGPAGSLVASMEAAGFEVVKPTARDATHASQGLYDDCHNGVIFHLDDPLLNAALAGAQKRPLGDAWAWARKGLSVDISPLVAFSNARWGLVSRPVEEKPAPATARTSEPDQSDLYRPRGRLNL